MSWLDLILSLVEKSGGDKVIAMKTVERRWDHKDLSNAMVEIVISDKSAAKRRSITRLLSWCTFAKSPLSIYQLQQILKLDASSAVLGGNLDVESEIEGNLKR